MATNTISRRHASVPLSELELHVLKLHTDKDWNFWQYKPDPPRSIIELRERFLATNAAGTPPRDDPPVAISNSPAPVPSPTFWDEFLKFEVRWAAIQFAIVISIVLCVTSVAYAVLR